MIKELLFSGLVLIFFSFSTEGRSYIEMIDQSRLIIKFQNGFTEDQQREILENVNGISNHLVFMNDPDLVIAYTVFRDGVDESLPDYFNLFEKCLTINGISYVGPFLENEKGHGFGILDKVFVKTKESASNAAIIERELLKVANNLTIKKSETFNQVLEIEAGGSGMSLLDLAIRLNAEPSIEFAEPNYLLILDSHTNDPILSQQWAIENLGTSQQGNGTPGADMDVRLAWQITTGDPDIKVAVMDSGVDTVHFDLVDNLLPGYDAFGEGTNGYPTPNFPEDGHGTACAGIIAATGDNGEGIAGVAYDASIIPVRIFRYADTSLMGVPLGVIPVSTSEVLADGIQWAWQNGADIQSHSWSLPDLFLTAGILPGNPALVEMAIAEAAVMGRGGKGSLLFFSSGNEGDPPNWPGRLPDAMAVNATSMCDEAKTPTSCDGQSWTGNWGDNLDFGAPGVRVYTTDMLGPNGYNNGIYNCCFGGTSAACPNVSGVAALLLSYDPELTLDESREILSRGCEKVGGYAYDSLAVYGTWTPELGYGRINAYHVLLEAGADPVSVETLVSDNELSVFPNPASEKIFINWQGIEAIQSVEVINVLGHSVVISDVISELSIAHLPVGVYFVKINFEENKTLTRKLVISR